MAEKSAKERLVDFLDRKAFRPVLEASADDYDSESQRRESEDVQAATRRERERYRDEYTSAHEVCDNFRDDLTSDEAKEVERQLRGLNLPALRDVEQEFARTRCRRFRTSSSSTTRSSGTSWPCCATGTRRPNGSVS